MIAAGAIRSAAMGGAAVSLRGSVGALMRSGRLPAGTTRVYSQGTLQGTVETGGARAVIRDSTGIHAATAELQRPYIYYRGRSGEALGYSRIIDRSRINHFAGQYPTVDYLGYDIIEGSIVRHFDKYGAYLGETSLEAAGSGASSAWAGAFVGVVGVGAVGLGMERGRDSHCPRGYAWHLVYDGRRFSRQCLPSGWDYERYREGYRDEGARRYSRRYGRDRE